MLYEIIHYKMQLYLCLKISIATVNQTHFPQSQKLYLVMNLILDPNFGQRKNFGMMSPMSQN